MTRRVTSCSETNGRCDRTAWSISYSGTPTPTNVARKTASLMAPRSNWLVAVATRSSIEKRRSGSVRSGIIFEETPLCRWISQAEMLDDRFHHRDLPVSLHLRHTTRTDELRIYAATHSELANGTFVQILIGEYPYTIFCEH